MTPAHFARMKLLDGIVEICSNKGYGMGVYVTHNRILTANHVVNDGNVYVGLGLNRAEILKQDEKLDLALLRRQETQFRGRLLMMNQSTPTPPFEAYRVDKEGTAIIPVQVHDRDPHNWLTDIGWPGLSGSPLLDSRGHILGIHTSSDEWFGYSVLVNKIRTFIDHRLGFVGLRK